jgi:hypothetical protein
MITVRGRARATNSFHAEGDGQQDGDGAGATQAGDEAHDEFGSRTMSPAVSTCPRENNGTAAPESTSGWTLGA